MAAGTLQYDEFVSGCQYYLEKLKSFDDGWQLRYSKFDKAIVYLVKKSVLPDSGVQKDSTINAELEKQFSQEENAEDKDNASNLGNCSSFNSSITFEYHIIYSISYNVPVLYFTAFTSGGRSLSLDEVWERVPKYHENALADKWSFLTQTEHPILGHPVFHVHPCNTAKMMQKLFHLEDGQFNIMRYLLVWISAVGPLVGLKLPFELFKEEKPFDR